MTDRPTRMLAIAVGLILLVALIAGVVSSRRPTTQFDRGTPQGVVQAYLGAVLGGDTTSAATYFAPNSSCAVADLEGAYIPSKARIALVDTSTTDTTAVVYVRVTRGRDNGPFDSGEYTESVTYRLVRTDGQWRLTGSPWPLSWCERGTQP